MVGAYKAYVQVRKGYAANGDCCGVYLGLLDGPYPCRVSCTTEVLHWDEKPESAFKKVDTHIYEAAQGRGWTDFISLSKLTDAASPYVKDGHITFTTTFRILPME